MSYTQVHLVLRHMRSSNRILVALFISFIIAGVVDGMAPVEAEWPLAFAMSHSFLIAILLYAWCGKHADEHQILPPAGARILTALIPLVGIPYYMLAGYGFGHGAVKMTKAMLFAALCGGAYTAILHALHTA